ncbi:MAG: hypothetical protein NT058_01280 [Candidatus Portnoybacteria bacterium]|nr:hypothetical protein [Candidatus Portnoybacteria bacterium]
MKKYVVLQKIRGMLWSVEEANSLDEMYRKIKEYLGDLSIAKAVIVAEIVGVVIQDERYVIFKGSLSGKAYDYNRNHPSFGGKEAQERVIELQRRGYSLVLGKIIPLIIDVKIG